MAFGKIDGAEPSTVTFQLRTVTHDINGATQHQEVVTIGGAVSSLAVAVVTDATPASTAFALAVREVAPSTTFTVRQSTAGDLNVTVAGYVAPSTTVSVSTGSVRVHQSSAADLNVTVAGYVAPSTVVSVSTGSVRVHQSSAADLNVTVSGYSTTVNVSSLSGAVQARTFTSSGGSVEGSTAAPAVGVLGLHVRQVLPTLQSTRVVITSSNSTALYTLVSSAADPLRHKVYAYHLTSTETSPSTLVFMSSNVIDRWAVSFGSGSSGVTGAISPGISPPAWLFHSDANNAVRCLIEKAASTQCIVTLSLSYFTEA